MNAIYTSADVQERVEELLRQQRPTDDELWDQTLRERDEASDAADQLTAAVSKLLRFPCGEHSNANNPWHNAIAAVNAAISGRPNPRPPIVTLCGSTQFKEAFEEVNRQYTLAGQMVFAPGVFGHADGIKLTEQQKTALDALHWEKIRQSDLVFIVNPGNYIGDSTRAEIAYATAIGVPIRYLVDPETQEA